MLGLAWREKREKIYSLHWGSYSGCHICILVSNVDPLSELVVHWRSRVSTCRSDISISTSPGNWHISTFILELHHIKNQHRTS